MVIGLSAGDKLKAWSGDQIVVDKDQSGKLRSDTLLLPTCFSIEKAIHSTSKGLLPYEIDLAFDDMYGKS